MRWMTINFTGGKMQNMLKAILSVIVAVMGTSGEARATGLVTLTPGSSVTISPSETTTVFCSGTSQYYCKCVSEGSYYRLVRVNLIDGKFVEDSLTSATMFESTCYTALKGHPACQRGKTIGASAVTLTDVPTGESPASRDLQVLP